MSLIRNSIPIQNKSMGDQINFMEWNKVVNQLSTQANMLTNVAENIIGNYFNFIWLPNNEIPIPNGVDIIIIPDNSLGDLVTDEETLANYFNKENSQYPPTEWKYKLIKYKRGTRILEILSTGVMKFSVDGLTQLLTGKQDKLTAGENITIDPNTNVISSSGIEFVISNEAPDKPNSIWLDTNPDLEIITTEQIYVPDYTPTSIPVFMVEDTGGVVEDLALPDGKLIIPEGDPEPLETDKLEDEPVVVGLIIPEGVPEPIEIEPIKVEPLDINSGLIIPEKEPEKLKE